MLGPLNALSLTSSIVQLLDFTSKVVAKGKEIYKSGFDLDALQLELESRELKAVAEEIARHGKHSGRLMVRNDYHSKKGTHRWSKNSVSGSTRNLHTNGEASDGNAKRDLKDFQASLRSLGDLSDDEDDRIEIKLRRFEEHTNEMSRLYDGPKGGIMRQLAQARLDASEQVVTLPLTLKTELIKMI